ncbi:MAG: hypothetical protein DCC67_09355 [Planctomycetota bacterium]|nr:MAG: hypothetical protein DCC67_09355 [Planctomycetota bacterium]
MATLVVLWLLPPASLEGAGLALRYGGVGPNGGHNWLVLLQPDAVGGAAVEIGFQLTGSAIQSLEPNLAVFDDLNPGQNPFTGSITRGVSVHNGGATAFAALGGVISEVQETLVLTVVADGSGTLALGGQNHNGAFTGARVWQGAAPVDGLAASLQVTATEADFTLDGSIDGADLLRWQRGFGVSSGAMRGDGDANADGAVNSADLAIWQGQFGAFAAVHAIPEPAAITVAVLAAALLLSHRQRPGPQRPVSLSSRGARPPAP